MLDDKLSFMQKELDNKNYKIIELEKDIREINHSKQQEISELTMKLENRDKKIVSLDSLVQSLRDSIENDKSIVNQDRELEVKILELENKIYLFEQNEMNMQRTIHAKNVELAETKIEMDRLLFAKKEEKTEKKFHKKSMSGFGITDTYDNSNFLDNLNNLNEETQNFLNSLLCEIEDLKKEKLEFQEKAIERITEKEMENIELKELLDQTKTEFQKEINGLMIKDNYKFDRLEDEDSKSISSFDSTKRLELLNKVEEYELQIQELKEELDHKSEEKEKILRANELVEGEYKLRITNLENEIVIIRMEINKLEMEKLEMQRELTSDSDTKDSFYRTIDEFQNKIKFLEDLKEKSEEKMKSINSSLNSQLEEIVLKNKQITYSLEKSTQEYNKLKESYQKKLSDLEINSKRDIEAKNKEISILSSKIDSLTKDNIQLKAENEKAKQNSEKHKNNLIEVQETLKNVKNGSMKEVKKWEDRYYELERKFEIEKNNLIENNSKLLKQINSTSYNTTSQNIIKQMTMKKTNEETAERTNTLEDINNVETDLLDEEEENITMLKMKFVSLEGQITILRNNITDLKINNENLQSQCDLLLKENKTKKEEYLSAVKIYEKQIVDLQRNSNKLQSERTSLRKSIAGDSALTPKQMQILSELHKTISNQKAENKYLVESNELLNKEKEDIEKLRLNDVNYYKDELLKAEQIAVSAKIQFATFVFEKEEETIKLKQLNKKLMDKLGLTYN